MDMKQRGQAAEVLKAIAHPVRLGILEALADRELNATELMHELDCGQSMMSQQLAKLVRQKLVAVRREKTSKFYTLQNRDLLRLFECMQSHLKNYLKFR